MSCSMSAPLQQFLSTPTEMALAELIEELSPHADDFHLVVGLSVCAEL